MSDIGEDSSVGEEYDADMRKTEEEGARQEQEDRVTNIYDGQQQMMMIPTQYYAYPHYHQQQQFYGVQGYHEGDFHQGYGTVAHPTQTIMSSLQSQQGYQFPQQQQPMDVPLPPGIPGLGGSTDPLEAVLGTFPCAHLRNLPYDATVEDILVLFQGLLVVDVVIVGQGDAFCVFANSMDFQMALQRSDRQTIGRRFVEIVAASRAEYYGAISEDQEGRIGLHVGLGSSEGEKQGDISPIWTAQQPGMQQSIPQHHHLQQQSQQMGGGYGEGMPGHSGARMSGMSRSGGIHAPLQKRSGGGIQVGEHTGFLRMRGLPFSANKEDIFKFFGGYNPILETIVLTYRNDGRATGEAYVGFATPEDSKRAMDLHRRSMGSRYIELFISNKEEHGRALARFGGR